MTSAPDRDARSAYDAVVIGVSAGGLTALDAILPAFSGDVHPAVLVVQHVSPDSGDYLATHFEKRCRVPVKEAEDKERIEPGVVYFAPPNYHLLVEPDHTLALSADERVKYSRPSIDVLFASAAEVFQDRLVGVILTGANDDGADGLATIKQYGGLAVVQSPDSAEADCMPKAAIAAVNVDYVAPLDRLGALLNTLAMETSDD